MEEAPRGQEEEQGRGLAAGAASEDELEFKPVVKYAGMGLALAALLGLEYATYQFGVQRGQSVAMASGQVTASVNAAAVENLTHFMQAATADDATLLEAVGNRQERLAWIKDAQVRREAEWTLLQALLDRSLLHEGTGLLAELIQQAPATGIWARRAMLAARGLADEGYKDAALAYYRCAADRYEALDAPQEQRETLSEMVELLAASSVGAENILPALDALQHKAAALGESGKELRANILAYMGRLYRVHGKHEEALKCFGQALSGVDPQKTPELASAAVCFGSALMEKGDTARAMELLRDGVSRLGENPADVPYLVTALRDLARLEQEAGNTDNALALLYRAEGAAAGRVAESSSFWICLYDQRGWVNYTCGAYEMALADFTRAISQQGAPEEMRAQPLEGAGRCCITLGQGDEAVRYLQECSQLRRKLFASDAASWGRANLLLGQAYDLKGDAAQAAAAYGQAIAQLPSENDNADRLYALLGQAYALTQLQQWENASAAWESLVPLVSSDTARKDEVAAQLQQCKRHLTATLPEAERTDADESPAPVRPKRTTARTRRR